MKFSCAASPRPYASLLLDRIAEAAQVRTSPKSAAVNAFVFGAGMWWRRLVLGLVLHNPFCKNFRDPTDVTLPHTLR
jgi:hypothetical protein